jgi:predicted metal-dependent hydrolase
MSGELPTALDQGINVFNEGKYFDAHEEWEKAWRVMAESDEKTFFQGLIMVSGSFLHYVRRECAGALKLLEKGIVMLKAGVGRHPDISVAEFVGKLEEIRDAFADCTFRIAAYDLPIIRRR